jgi:hypothetical protein
MSGRTSFQNWQAYKTFCFKPTLLPLALLKNIVFRAQLSDKLSGVQQ